jgi:uncharacterized membrane protein YhaH (DUF805 family)
MTERQTIMPRARRFPWWVYWVLLALILVLMLAPVASITAAGMIADSAGCRLDEGSPHPCLVNGVDRGETVYTLAMLGWLMLLTVPVGAIALIVWGIVLALHRGAWGRRGSA